MGLFSTKKKHLVDTSVMRVIEDDMIISSVQKGTIAAVLRGNEDVGKSILNSIIDSSSRGFENMYKFAEKEGNYFYGLPNAKVLTNSDGVELAKAALESELEEAVDIDYMYFRPLNNVHMGRKHITENYGYNHATNQIDTLTAEKGVPVYLDKMIAVYQTDPDDPADPTSVGEWGELSSSGITPGRLAGGVSSLITDREIRSGPLEVESVDIHYIWEIDGTTFTSLITLDLSEYDAEDREYYQGRYTLGSGEVGYWLYDPLTQRHPELDSVFELSYTDPGTYFPFTIFRDEKESMTMDSKTMTTPFKDTVELLDHLGMDFKGIGDSLTDAEGIEDVEQAVMMMAVPITSQNEVEMDYLHKYFSSLYDQLPDRPAFRVTRDDLSTEDAYAIDISDADFRMILSINKITRTLRAGKLDGDGTKIGFVTNTTRDSTAPAEVERALFLNFLVPRSERVFRKQVSNTVYEEIVVVSPKVRYPIAHGKSAVGNFDDDRLLIPLDYELTKGYSILDKEQLYYRSLHFVFNSYVIQKIKWYQSSWFRAVMIIVAVVITVLSVGKSWKLAVAAAGIGAATITIIGYFIIDLLISFAYAKLSELIVQQVVELIGPEAALYLAIAAMARGGYKAFKAGGVVVNSTAHSLLKVGMNLINGATHELSDMMKELAADAAAFDSYAEGKWEELEEANKLLDTSTYLDPFMFVGMQPMFIPGEEPDAFYDRVNGVDLGTKSLNIVQNYHDISLRLPSTQETIGNMANA